MNQALNQFLQAAQNAGIKDLSEDFARQAGLLMTRLAELKVPAVVLECVYVRCVHRLRAADPQNFQRGFNEGRMSYSDPWTGTIPAAMGFIRVTDVTSEIQRLVLSAAAHLRDLGNNFTGEERQAYCTKIEQLCKQYGMPEELIKTMMPNRAASSYFGGTPNSEHLGAAFPGYDHRPMSDSSIKGWTLPSEGDKASERI